MRPDVDVAILGGGCAGLSLAVRLAGGDQRVAVIEPRTSYCDDRTWSFWRTGSDPFDDCVRARWGRWSVANNGETVVRTSPSLRYQSVSALAFYEKSQSLIGDACNTTLHLGSAVTEEPVRDWTGNALCVETTQGRLKAGVVVDTRPQDRPTGFGQWFVGREIRVDGDVFDDRTVEMMAFEEPRNNRVDFIYVLPFTRDRALIEATSFAAARPEAADFTAMLERAINRRTRGLPSTTIREERGFIPMRVDPATGAASTGDPRWVRAGLAGGAARPSTGYAFQRIQAAADLQAIAIGAGSLPPSAVIDSRFTRWMDALFLRVLQRWPERAPELFVKLFRHAPTDRLERFLSGSTAAQDRLAVIGALPPAPFLRQLFAG